MVHTGSCLCGNVTVTVRSHHTSQIACHCKDCQHTSGSAFSTNILAKISDVEIDGIVKEYDSKGASGNTVTRMFCSGCGAPVAHKSAVFGDSMAVQTGLLNFNEIPFAAELFVKDRWLAFPPLAHAKQAEAMLEN